MMTLEDYALDVNKSIEEIMEMCDKIGISYQDDQTLLSDEDIILLDNQIQDSEDYIEGDISIDEEDEEQLLEEFKDNGQTQKYTCKVEISTQTGRVYQVYFYPIN